jgi:chaperonin cofactor prefoldin
MDDQELRKLLEQLHTEIEHTQTIDNNGRQLLHHLEADINELLERPESGPLPQAHPSTIQQLEDSINYFELSHPTLTSQLSKLLSILSNAGI